MMKEKTITIVLTILLSVFCLIPIFEFKTYSKEKPKDLYRVYLNGKSIGVIDSKKKLENYINKTKDLYVLYYLYKQLFHC